MTSVPPPSMPHVGSAPQQYAVRITLNDDPSDEEECAARRNPPAARFFTHNPYRYDSSWSPLRDRMRSSNMMPLSEWPSPPPPVAQPMPPLFGAMYASPLQSGRLRTCCHNLPLSLSKNLTADILRAVLNVVAVPGYNALPDSLAKIERVEVVECEDVKKDGRADRKTKGKRLLGLVIHYSTPVQNTPWKDVQRDFLKCIKTRLQLFFESNGSCHSGFRSSVWVGFVGGDNHPNYLRSMAAEDKESVRAYLSECRDEASSGGRRRYFPHWGTMVPLLATVTFKEHYC